MKTFTFILCSIISLWSFAQDPSFNISVSTDSVLMGNYIAVTFSIENGEGNNFEAPGFADFNIVGGPSQSSSISIINGVSTQSKSYTYYIEPKEEGLFYIEPASVEIDGQVLETAPLEIKVAPNPEGIIQQPQQRKNRTFDSFFNDSFFDDPFFNSPFFERRSPEKPEEKKEPAMPPGGGMGDDMY